MSASDQVSRGLATGSAHQASAQQLASMHRNTRLAGAAAGQAVPHEQRVQVAVGQRQRRVRRRLVLRRPDKPLVRHRHQVLQLL